MQNDNALPSPHPSRGAPPGNTNAVKHGFYSRRLRKRDLQDLDALPLNSLLEEVAILRVFIRKVIEYTKEQPDFLTTLAILRAVSLASDSISRLLRTQIILQSDSQSDGMEILTQITADIARELSSLPDDL